MTTTVHAQLNNRRCRSQVPLLFVFLLISQLFLSSFFNNSLVSCETPSTAAGYNNNCPTRETLPGYTVNAIRKVGKVSSERCPQLPLGANSICYSFKITTRYLAAVTVHELSSVTLNLCDKYEGHYKTFMYRAPLRRDDQNVVASCEQITTYTDQFFPSTSQQKEQTDDTCVTGGRIRFDNFGEDVSRKNAYYFFCIVIDPEYALENPPQVNVIDYGYKAGKLVAKSQTIGFGC